MQTNGFIVDGLWNRDKEQLITVNPTARMTDIATVDVPLMVPGVDV